MQEAEAENKMIWVFLKKRSVTKVVGRGGGNGMWSQYRKGKNLV